MSDLLHEAGNPGGFNQAKAQIRPTFEPREGYINLRMEVSNTDHPQLIGHGGATIRQMMEDTGCRIHFPDSNRFSNSRKSNRVGLIGGSVPTVEAARSRIRELSSLQIRFPLPYVTSVVKETRDMHCKFIDKVESDYNVQVTVHPPDRLQQTSVTVKGCEIDAAKIKEAISKIVGYFSGENKIDNLHAEITMEIFAGGQGFVRGANDRNLHGIMMNTGAKIIFPDLSDNNISPIKQSRVIVSGGINSVYNARQQLIGCLPLQTIVKLANNTSLDWETVRMIGSKLYVKVELIDSNHSEDQHGSDSSPFPIPCQGRTIRLITAERNAVNLYECRRRLLRSSLKPPTSVSIPSTYALRPPTPSENIRHYGNRLTAPPGPLQPLMLPTRPKMLSSVLSPSFWPPNPYASPFCTPRIATCVVNNGSGRNNKNEMSRGDTSPGSSKMHGVSYEQYNSYGNKTNNLLHHVRPMPEFSLATMDAITQNMHLSLMDNHGNKSFHTTPSSTVSESAGSAYPMNNNLIQDFRDLGLKRKKAPGWERSNTSPNLVGRTSVEAALNVTDSVSKGSFFGDSIADNTVATNKVSEDIKYIDVKAMHNTKIGPHPRLPNSDGVGCELPRTHLALLT